MDTFARDHLPPQAAWPEIHFGLPELRYQARLNAATELLAGAASADMPCLRAEESVWTYRQLALESDRIAVTLVRDLEMVPGNRVLLRGFNTPELVAAWFAVLKAGGIAVTTMPLLRAKELGEIIEKAQVSHALVEAPLANELQAAANEHPVLGRTATIGPGGEVEPTSGKNRAFAPCDTAADDVALIAFTSGTTGQPKGCVHFHRDVLAICDTYARHLLRPSPDDVFVCTAPLGFTFGLGSGALFPLRFGASAALIAKPSPSALCETIERNGATVLSTAPTMYRNLLASEDVSRLSSLRLCVSAGEPLPAATSDAWHERTDLRIADGIGSTELLHIFISAVGDDIRPGSTGRAIPGYEAIVMGDEGEPLPPDEVGHLAVRGPTGCRYLDDPRQSDYVQHGWNVTGDAYRRDADGYFWFHSRTDDLIISSGYNISGLEVENALLAHPEVVECAVVGVTDEMRGQVVKAFVVPREGGAHSEQKVAELQDFVKDRLAPYKYPREVEFLDEIPKTQTGKVQRFRLRERAAEPIGG